MYSIDYLEYIDEAVKKKLHRERQRFNKFYIRLEKYASQHVDVIIGGGISTDLVLQRKRSLDDYEYELYSEKAFVHANNLINELNEVNDENFILFLKTVIPNFKYQIVVDNRLLAVFFQLDINSRELILPLKVLTFDKKSPLTVEVLSPEIQLIDLYRTLYSPAQMEFWEIALKSERRLFDYLKSRVKKIKGADENEKNKEREINLTERRELETQILESLVAKNPNVVLIGEHAVRLIDPTIAGNHESSVIQLISQNDIEDDFAVLQKIVQRVFKESVPISKVDRQLHIMKDFRLRRTIFKVGQPAKEILYIYNCAQYDLIPFNIFKDYQIGNPFVLLRFLIIDFWMVRYVRLLGAIDEVFAEKRLNSIFYKLLSLRAKMSGQKGIDPKYFDSLEDPKLRIFQSSSDDYIGFFEDESIFQKTLAKEMPKKYFDYYPAEYKRRNGEYRVIESKK